MAAPRAQRRRCCIRGPFRQPSASGISQGRIERERIQPIDRCAWTVMAPIATSTTPRKTGTAIAERPCLRLPFHGIEAAANRRRSLFGQERKPASHVRQERRPCRPRAVGPGSASRRGPNMKGVDRPASSIAAQTAASTCRVSASVFALRAGRPTQAARSGTTNAFIAVQRRRRLQRRSRARRPATWPSRAGDRTNGWTSPSPNAGGKRAVGKKPDASRLAFGEVAFQTARNHGTFPDPGRKGDAVTAPFCVSRCRGGRLS